MMLAGCVGSLPPIGASGAMPQSRPIATHAERGKPWMLGKAASGDLLYVADAESQAIDIYSYPKDAKVGQLAGYGMPLGLCVDGAGDIFVTNVPPSGAPDIIEFSHGGTKPIQTLNDPGMLPGGCAVNPISGDLAVANYCPYHQGECGGRGNILIYPHAKGSPRSRRAPGVSHFSYCAHDNVGTLYADGFGRHSHFFELVELPKSGDNLTPIEIHWTYSEPEIIDPGGIQWDGKFLAIGYPQGENIIPSIYRVDPATGRIAAVLTLHKSQSVFQFFIDGNVLIAPNSMKDNSGQVLFYSYPKGAKLSKAIGGLYRPEAVVVSRPPPELTHPNQGVKADAVF